MGIKFQLEGKYRLYLPAPYDQRCFWGLNPNDKENKKRISNGILSNKYSSVQQRQLAQRQKGKFVVGRRYLHILCYLSNKKLIFPKYEEPTHF